MLQTITDVGSVQTLCWFADHSLVVNFSRSKDLLLVHCTTEFYQKNKVFRAVKRDERTLRPVRVVVAVCCRCSPQLVARCVNRELLVCTRLHYCALSFRNCPCFCRISSHTKRHEFA